MNSQRKDMEDGILHRVNFRNPIHHSQTKNSSKISISKILLLGTPTLIKGRGKRTKTQKLSSRQLELMGRLDQLRASASYISATGKEREESVRDRETNRSLREARLRRASREASRASRLGERSMQTSG